MPGDGGADESSRSPRAPARPAGCTSATCASSSPCTSSPRSSRRRGLTDPAPARLGRLRPVPQGAGRRRPVVERAHRPAAVRRPGPDGCHDSWAEHFKAPLRDALHAMGVDMEEVSQTERYRAGHYRDAVLTAVARAGRDRGACWPATAPRPVELESAADDDERRGRGQRRPGPVPLQALLPRLRPRHGHADVVRRRDDRPRLHLRRHRLRGRHQPDDRLRGQAGLEGRLADALGLRARRLRAGRHGPRHARARRSPSATSWSRASTACRGRPGSATASSASPASRRCRRRPAARRPRRTRCGSWRRRSCAGSTCAATRGRPSTSTSAPRWSGSTTSGTRSAARPPTPRSATPRCWPTSGRLDVDRRAAADPAGRRAVPAAVLGRRRHRRLAEQISRIVEHAGHPHASVEDLEPRLTRR